MTINARLDEIAKHYAQFVGHDDEDHLFVRAAIDKAIELVLTAEPKAWMNEKGMVSSAPGGGYDIPLVSAALLEEIKK